MWRAAVVLLVIACGAPAREAAHRRPDDRRIVERFEIRGVSDARAAELRALVRAHIGPGVELTEARYDAAHHAIENDYYDRGHAAVQITWPDFAKHTGSFTLVVTIREGPRFKIAALLADDPRFLALATLRTGDHFSRSKLRAWMQAIAEIAPAAQPETHFDLVDETVTITVHPGPRP